MRCTRAAARLPANGADRGVRRAAATHRPLRPPPTRSPRPARRCRRRAPARSAGARTPLLGNLFAHQLLSSPARGGPSSGPPRGGVAFGQEERPPRPPTAHAATPRRSCRRLPASAPAQPPPRRARLRAPCFLGTGGASTPRAPRVRQRGRHHLAPRPPPPPYLPRSVGPTPAAATLVAPALRRHGGHPRQPKREPHPDAPRWRTDGSSAALPRLPRHPRCRPAFFFFPRWLFFVVLWAADVRPRLRCAAGGRRGLSSGPDATASIPTPLPPPPTPPPPCPTLDVPSPPTPPHWHHAPPEQHDPQVESSLDLQAPRRRQPTRGRPGPCRPRSGV